MEGVVRHRRGDIEMEREEKGAIGRKLSGSH